MNEISGATALPQTGINDIIDPDNGQSLVIPVIEERVSVEKKTVETGKVRISKTVSEEEEVIDVTAMQEEVIVERIPVNRFVDTVPQTRYEGDTMIVPVTREVIVVEKRLELIEELHITKRQNQTPSFQQVTLRKEEVTVERIANENTTPKTDL